MLDMASRKLTKAQLDECREAFNLFDKNGDGKITSDELYSAMRAIRQETTLSEIHEMINHFDIDGNGTIEFDEFVQMMVSRKTTESEEEAKARREKEVRQAFKVFDIDGDGLIDAMELKQTMSNLGETLTDADVNAMIKAADRNKDGKIDFDEFTYLIMTH